MMSYTTLDNEFRYLTTNPEFRKPMPNIFESINRNMKNMSLKKSIFDPGHTMEKENSPFFQDPNKPATGTTEEGGEGGANERREGSIATEHSEIDKFYKQQLEQGMIYRQQQALFDGKGKPPVDLIIAPLDSTNLFAHKYPIRNVSAGGVLSGLSGQQEPEVNSFLKFQELNQMLTRSLLFRVRAQSKEMTENMKMGSHHMNLQDPSEKKKDTVDDPTASNYMNLATNSETLANTHPFFKNSPKIDVSAVRDNIKAGQITKLGPVEVVNPQDGSKPTMNIDKSPGMIGSPGGPGIGSGVYRENFSPIDFDTAISKIRSPGLTKLTGLSNDFLKAGRGGDKTSPLDGGPKLNFPMIKPFNILAPTIREPNTLDPVPVPGGDSFDDLILVADLDFAFALPFKPPVLLLGLLPFTTLLRLKRLA